MKKTLIYLSMAASLLALSCTRSELDQPMTGNGSGLAIRLGVRSADAISTRATATGDSTYVANENKVNTLDYFLFYKDPSTNTTEEAFLQGRLTFSDFEPVTEDLAREKAEFIDLKDYYSDESADKNVHVYVIANLTDDYEYKDGKLYSGTTELVANWTTLQALEIATDFKKTLSSGQFKPQDGFVMTGLKSQLLTGKGPDEVIVDLSRIASKITVDLNVVKLFDEYKYNTAFGVFEYQATYFPNVEHTQVYLSYVDSTSFINPPTSSYDQTFFTYNRYAFDPEVTESSFKNQILKRDEEGAIVVGPDGKPEYEESAEFPAFGVSGSPFYSYPITWDPKDPHAPFIKIIIPWVKYKIPSSAAALYQDYAIENKVTHMVDFDPTKDSYKAIVNAAQDSGFPLTLDVTYNGNTYTLDRLTSPASMNGRYGDEFYYKVNIPSEEYKLDPNNWYMIKLDISVLGSESDDASVIISGSKMGIFVMDWSTPEDLGGDLDGGRFLSTAQKEYRFDAVNSITIPVISSHTIDADIVTAQRKVKGVWVNVERGEVTTSGTDKLTLTNALNNTIGGDLDCYPFRFVVKITQKNSDGTTTGTLEEVITITQYPPIYVDTIPGGNAMVDGYYGNVDNHYKTGFVLGTGGNGMEGGTAFANTNTYREGTNSGITVAFGNSTYNNNNMRVGTTRSNGTITITAPEGGPNITEVYVRYSGDNDVPTYYTWTVSDGYTTSPNAYSVWRGSARQVVLSMRRENNGYATVQRVAVYSNSTTSSGSGNSNSGNTERSVSTPYAPIVQNLSSSREPNMTVITISTLGDNSKYTRPRDQSIDGSSATEHDYLIADPRQLSGYSSRDLVPYWSGSYNNGQAVAWDDGIAREIRVGNRRITNLIAPRFLVSSAWGRTVDWGSDARSAATYEADYETAEKRCATYQEAGYPAGRWRLPTEAEIFFTKNLQQYSFISTLFSDGSYNATASGSILRLNGTTFSYYSKNERINSMRCVYDLWYWGDEPVDGAESTYTIDVD